eukprot:scaffold55908_cov32-Tisochrysis_lutea.AAC.4
MPRRRSERELHPRPTRRARATARATSSLQPPARHTHCEALKATMATQASPPLQPYTTSPKVGHRGNRKHPIGKAFGLGLGPYIVVALVSCASASTRHRPDQTIQPLPTGACASPGPM